MNDLMDSTPDRKDEPSQPPLPKAVKTGAYLGLAAGWMVGLVWVLGAFRPMSFEQRDTADGILIAAPIIGAGAGAVVGWLLRNSPRLMLITAPSWVTFKEVRWGYRTGGIVGILLARQYIAAHSPLGFYTGSIALVFELIAPIFAILGGAIGLALATKGDGAVPPTP